MSSPGWGSSQLVGTTGVLSWLPRGGLVSLRWTWRCRLCDPSLFPSHQGKPGARGLPGPPGQLGPEVRPPGSAPAHAPPAPSLLCPASLRPGLGVGASVRTQPRVALGSPSSPSLTALLCDLSRGLLYPGLAGGPLLPSLLYPTVLHYPEASFSEPLLLLLPQVAQVIGTLVWEGRSCWLCLRSEALRPAGVQRLCLVPWTGQAGPGLKHRSA